MSEGRDQCLGEVYYHYQGVYVYYNHILKITAVSVKRKITDSHVKDPTQGAAF